MRITYVCYNQTKRKRIQFLLAIFFSLGAASCIYIATQKPRKTILYVNDVNRIPKWILSKALILEPSQLGEDKKAELTNFKTAKNIYRDITSGIQSSRSSGEQIKSDNVVASELRESVIKTDRMSSDDSILSSGGEEKFKTGTGNISDSLRGILNHHVWENVCSHQVESLREFILYPQTPSKRRSLSTSSTKLGDNGNNFGERIFGFILPQTSGKHQFAISSSWNSELWLSSDENSENLRKIASLGSRDNPGGSDIGNFSASPYQISSYIFLNKGVRYFLDIIHKHQMGKSHLEVAWRLPGEVKFTVITSEFLLAKMNDTRVPDNAVPLYDYKEHPRSLDETAPPFVNFEEVERVLPSCFYQPSYLVKHRLIRFQGARNKSNTHFAAVYPPDSTNNSMPLLGNEDIWWKENAVGNSITNKNVAEDIVRSFMERLEAERRNLYQLRRIISVEHVPDPQKGDRFLLELMLTDNKTEESLVFSEYVYRPFEKNKLCYPEGFQWKKDATVNIIVPVRNAGRWALYFIRNIAEIVLHTLDPNINVVIIDYESSDINIEAALRKSSLQRYTVVRIPAEETFQRAKALQRGAGAVNDPHSILFLCDLHLKIPAKLISTIRKHCVEGKMAFAPVVKRLRCGFYPDLPFGYWETLGFGLLAIFKSDFDRVGGMNTREFTGWGGEDWELLDRILMNGYEVERLKIPDFYHFYHPPLSGSNQRVGA